MFLHLFLKECLRIYGINRRRHTLSDFIRLYLTNYEVKEVIYHRLPQLIDRVSLIPIAANVDVTVLLSVEPADADEGHRIF
jgi:hypothetical protein